MFAGTGTARCQWNKGKLVGQKLPPEATEIWVVRFRLQLEHRTRELAPSNPGIDSKLRGCDVVTLRVRDAAEHTASGQVRDCRADEGHDRRLGGGRWS